MGKYVDIESGVVKQSGLEIEDVIQKILHDFFKYENNSLSTEDDDSKKVSNYFMKLGLLTLGDSNDPVSRASQRRRKKEEDDFEREREKDRGTNVRNKVAMDTASELKRRVDLEEQKFQYQKTENLMVRLSTV